MKNLRLYFYLIFFFNASVSFSKVVNWNASTREDVALEFEKINSWYRNHDTYSVVLTHSSFEDYTSPISFESSLGYFKKYKNEYHSYILGTHSIQNDKYKIVVDSTNTIVMVANPDNSFADGIGLKDFSDGLLVCNTFKKSETQGEKKIRLEFGEYQSINAFEITYFPEGNVKEIEVYYNTKVAKDDDDKEAIKKKPRLSIVFSDYTMGPKFINKQEFSEEKYISITKEKKLLLQSNYKTYKLSDQRLINN